MADNLAPSEQRVLAQVLVCGDVQQETLYKISPMLTTAQERALASLDDQNILNQTLFEYNGP